jgi:hypothetical protein
MGRARDIANVLSTNTALATDAEVAAFNYLTQSSASSTYTPLSSPVTSYKNKIINSEFDIWQRGTTFSAGGYTADRWLLQVDGSSATRAVSQQTLTLGSITGYESAFFLRYNQSVAGSSATFNILDQRIEDVRTLAGQVVTVSFWAKADSSRTITSSIQQSFGSGGSSEVAGLVSGNINITTSWTRYSYTGTLASISGKTIGANSYAALRFNFPLNTTFTVDIWGVQVERGSIATEFEQRFIGDELRMCQRYYEKSYDLTTVPGTSTDIGALLAVSPGNVNRVFASIQLRVSKRGQPTYTIYSTTGASGNMRDLTAGADKAVSLSTSAGENGVGIVTTAGITASSNTVAFQYVANAEL